MMQCLATIHEHDQPTTNEWPTNDVTVWSLTIRASYYSQWGT